MALADEVLRRVVPSEEEEARIRETVEDVQRRVRDGLAKRGIPGEPLLVGSVAKGTHLSDAEIDIFVCFPRETARDVLEKVGLALGEFLEDKTRMYAEHPYTRGRWRGFEVEVVPCYRIDDVSQKMSAVDRTPLHAAYVIANLTEKARAEVRLLKAFCEGVGVYGAEAKVQGFSGYLCELLVLRYGTFRGVLEAATRWRRGEVLELDLAAGKAFEDPLVVIDPIDAERNVASAVSAESMATFVHAARSFLEKPGLTFFFPKPRKPLTAAQAKRILARRGTTLLGIALPSPDLTDDVLYPQVRKAQRAIEETCRREDFRIARSRASVVGGRVLLLFEFEVFALPRARKHLGPPVWVKNAEDFLRRWRGSKDALTSPYVEDDRWVVDVRREATDAAAFLKGRLPALSLGAHLDGLAAKARFLKDGAVLREPYLADATALLDPRFPWT